jgi:hypothetical protein
MCDEIRHEREQDQLQAKLIEQAMTERAATPAAWLH